MTNNKWTGIADALLSLLFVIIVGSALGFVVVGLTSQISIRTIPAANDANQQHWKVSLIRPDGVLHRQWDVLSTELPDIGSGSAGMYIIGRRYGTEPINAPIGWLLEVEPHGRLEQP